MATLRDSPPHYDLKMERLYPLYFRFQRKIHLNYMSYRTARFCLLLSSCFFSLIVPCMKFAMTSHFALESITSVTIFSGVSFVPVSAEILRRPASYTSHSNTVCSALSSWCPQNQHSADCNFPNLCKYAAKHP